MEGSGRTEEELVLEARVSEQPCGSCGSSDVVAIEMSFEGSPVSVQICSECETRTWSRDGEAVDLDSLLPAMRTTTRARSRNEER